MKLRTNVGRWLWFGFYLLPSLLQMLKWLSNEPHGLLVNSLKTSLSRSIGNVRIPISEQN
ncbi:7295_t:CDS:1, partial [Acaulospora morrowiae]